MNLKFEKEFNELLVEAFHLILQTELKMIKKSLEFDLSMREIHLIEIIGRKDGEMTISEVAKAFQITMASVTVMVNKLIEKGHLIKTRCDEDGRQVRLALTKSGHGIDAYHFSFHKEMVERIAGHLSDFEKEVCSNAVQRLNKFIREELEKD